MQSRTQRAARVTGDGEGEIPAITHHELTRLGVPDEAVVRANSDLRAVGSALAWAKPGDGLLLLVHSQRRAVLELLRQRPTEAGTFGH